MSHRDAMLPVRILLVEDQVLAREAVRELLASEPGFEVVAEAGSGEEALQLAGEMHPDVVIMDLSLPGWNGIEATRRMHESYPRVNIVGLSLHTDPRMQEEMQRAGAAAFIQKDLAFEELLHAIRRVASSNHH